jgi:hypothetical protein
MRQPESDDYERNHPIQFRVMRVRGYSRYELWQTDLTAVWCGEGGWDYFTAVLACSDRSILGWYFTVAAARSTSSWPWSARTHSRTHISDGGHAPDSQFDSQDSVPRVDPSTSTTSGDLNKPSILSALIWNGRPWALG